MFTGTEYLAYCPSTTIYDAGGDMLFSGGGGSVFGLFNRTTKTSKSYDLPFTQSRGGALFDSKVWISVFGYSGGNENRNTLASIDVATGGVTAYSAMENSGDTNYTPLVIAGKLFMFRAINNTVSLRLCTSPYTTYPNYLGVTWPTSSYVSYWVVGNRLLIQTVTQILVYDCSGSSPSLLATVDSSTPGNSWILNGVANGWAYFWRNSSVGAGSYWRLNLVTYQLEPRSLTPAGAPFTGFGKVLGPDGYFYSFGGNGLFAINPLTEQWRTDTLPNTRTRGNIVVAGGKLWMASTAPTF